MFGLKMNKINLLARNIVNPLHVVNTVIAYLTSRWGVRNATTDIRDIVMNNDLKMPALGIGTWMGDDNFAIKGKRKPMEGKEMSQMIKKAIDCGYRHIDTAFVYGNEDLIGDAINEKILEQCVKRKDIFLVTKLWNTFHDPENVRRACKKSLCNLGLNYIDMYLMHTPMGVPAQDDDRIFAPVDKHGKPLFSGVDYVATWRAMEDLIKRVLKFGTIVPQVHQIEHHPYLTQKYLIGFCKAHKIRIIAYAPLGSPNRPWAGKDTIQSLMKNEKIVNIAKKHKKRAAQILLRYQVEQGHATIPSMGRTERNLKQNVNICDFHLYPEDIRILDSLNSNIRYFKLDGASDHPHYPFHSA